MSKPLDEGSITGWDIGIFKAGQNYPPIPLSADDFTPGTLMVKDMDGDGIDEIIGLHRDSIALDTVLGFSGGGQVDSDNGVHGLAVYRLT